MSGSELFLLELQRFDYQLKAQQQANQLRIRSLEIREESRRVLRREECKKQVALAKIKRSLPSPRATTAEAATSIDMKPGQDQESLPERVSPTENAVDGAENAVDKAENRDKIGNHNLPSSTPTHTHKTELPLPDEVTNGNSAPVSAQEMQGAPNSAAPVAECQDPPSIPVACSTEIDDQVEIPADIPTHQAEDAPSVSNEAEVRPTRAGPAHSLAISLTPYVAHEDAQSNAQSNAGEVPAESEPPHWTFNYMPRADDYLALEACMLRMVLSAVQARMDWWRLGQVEPYDSIESGAVCRMLARKLLLLVADWIDMIRSRAMDGEQ